MQQVLLSPKQPLGHHQVVKGSHTQLHPIELQMSGVGRKLLVTSRRGPGPGSAACRDPGTRRCRRALVDDVAVDGGAGGLHQAAQAALGHHEDFDSEIAKVMGVLARSSHESLFHAFSTRRKVATPKFFYVMMHFVAISA